MCRPTPSGRRHPRLGPRPAPRSRQSLATTLDPDQPVVVYLGALSSEKDPLLAIDVMGEVPDAQLVVAGSGPLGQQAAARAAAVAPERIRVVGAVREPASLLAAADALILPSRTEGIPAVAIEAGLAGLPVVAARVGGLAEVVVDGETGVLVDERSPGAMAAALRRVLAGGHGDVGDGRGGARDASSDSASTWWWRPGSGCSTT